MTNLKTTKRALFSSVIALLVCFTMLLGTTFAWFTDSVTSSGNIIQTGTLDVSLEHADTVLGVDDEGWTDASTGAIFNYSNWEPGYTAVKYVKIENEGSLDLKFILNIIPNNAAEEVNLADVIEVYMVSGAVAVDRDALTTDSDAYVGNLTSLMNETDGAAHGVLYADATKGNVYEIYTIALKMSTSAGNEYMGKNVGGGFAVQLLATQLASESDSFDNGYDAGAKYENEVDIEGATMVSYGLYQGTDGTYYITAVQGLMTMRTMVADEETYDDDGKWVLYNSINLDGINWTPINGFHGTFDGNGKTISNLTVSTDGVAGLFGKNNLNGDGFATKPVIKNLTVSNSTVTGDQCVAVVAGDMGYAAIEKVTVIDSTINGNKYVGGIIGKAYANDGVVISNCSVIESTIKAEGTNADGKVGGIGGFVAYGTVTGNKVEGCTISGPECVGGIVGRAGSGETQAIVYGNTVSGNTVTGTETETVGEVIGDKLNVKETE